MTYNQLCSLLGPCIVLHPQTKTLFLTSLASVIAHLTLFLFLFLASTEIYPFGKDVVNKITIFRGYETDLLFLILAFLLISLIFSFILDGFSIQKVKICDDLVSTNFSQISKRKTSLQIESGFKVSKRKISLQIEPCSTNFFQSDEKNQIDNSLDIKNSKKELTECSNETVVTLASMQDEKKVK